MIHSRRDRTMLIAMGVLLLFAVYNFLIRPQGADLSTLRDERVTIEQKVSAAQAALLAPPDTSGTEAPEEAEPAAVESAVPADPAVSQLLRQLETIASETGMVHSSITPSTLTANPNGPGGSLPIGISASGSHESALAYVQRLRDLDRLVVVEQVGLVVQPDGGDQLQITARVFTSSLPVELVPGAP